jgi:hypothetical protein
MTFIRLFCLPNKLCDAEKSAVSVDGVTNEKKHHQRTNPPPRWQHTDMSRLSTTTISKKTDRPRTGFCLWTRTRALYRELGRHLLRASASGSIIAQETDASEHEHGQVFVLHCAAKDDAFLHGSVHCQHNSLLDSLRHGGRRSKIYGPEMSEWRCYLMMKECHHPKRKTEGDHTENFKRV